MLNITVQQHAWEHVMGDGVVTVGSLCRAGSAGAVNRGAISTSCVIVPAHVLSFWMCRLWTRTGQLQCLCMPQPEEQPLRTEAP